MVRIPARSAGEVHPAEAVGPHIADFYCASRWLVIELDGDSHYNDRAEAYDERRTRELAALGIRVIRVSNADVMRGFEGVCAMILQAIDARP
jgi:very-short-patch-repair endonuclease